MADHEQLDRILKQGVQVWNKWWARNLDVHIDLSGADLTGAYLRNVALRNADLRNVALRNADLRNADLRNADLRNADLLGATLTDADLSGASLNGARLSNVYFRYAHLTDADLSGAELSGAHLSETTLTGVDLSGARLDGADLSGAHLRGATLGKADLRNADLTGATLSGADFRNATLFNATLSEADLSGADLRNADLTDATLFDATLFNAILSGATLGNATLRNADLSGATLSGADLSGTLFSDADLSGADLRNADLSGTLFSDAHLAYTIFGGVDLSTVKGLEAVKHQGPSTIGIDTIYLSQGNISEVFLKKAGVPDSFIDFMRSLVSKPFDYSSCFISYSSKDQAFAERLYADLQSKGVRCWFAPEDIKIGVKFRSRIDEAIHMYDKLLLVLSEHSIRSPWVKKEVEQAFEKERKRKKLMLFPVRLDDTVNKTRQAWAADLRRIRHIGDFRQWKDHNEYQKAFARLLRDLKAEAQKI